MSYVALKNNLAKVRRVRELTFELHPHVNREHGEMIVQSYLAAGVQPEELEEAVRAEDE